MNVLKEILTTKNEIFSSTRSVEYKTENKTLENIIV